MGRCGIQLSTFGFAGSLLARTTRTPQPDSVEAATNLGSLRTRAGFLGQNKWRAASDCPAGMRAELPHVLRDHAVIREQTGIDLAPGGAWDSRRVSLSAAASLSDGFAVW